MRKIDPPVYILVKSNDMPIYIDILRLKARKLNESSDRITLEPLPLNETETKRHETVAMEGHGRLHLWRTSSLYEWLVNNNTHPLTRRSLNLFELAYVEAYFNFLLFEEANQTLDDNRVYQSFIESGGELKDQELLAARALLSPYHFADHFKEYKPLPAVIRYEREQAERYLNDSCNGSWLLRYSSLNRPASQAARELIERLGIEYYAISYTVPKIQHTLIMHRPGWGWAVIKDVTYGERKVYPESAGGYSVCFIDLLLKTIKRLDLKFSEHISGYMF